MKRLVFFIVPSGRNDIVEFLNGNTFECDNIDAFREYVRKKFAIEDVTYITKPDGLCFSLNVGLIKQDRRSIAAVWLDTKEEKMWVFDYRHTNKVDCNIDECFTILHRTKEGARNDFNSEYNEIVGDVDKETHNLKICGSENYTTINLDGDVYELSIYQQDIED